MSLSKTLYPLLSTGQPRKTCPNMTEKMLTRTLRIKSNKIFILDSSGLLFESKENPIH